MSVLGSKLSPITIVLISVLLSGQLFVGVTGQCVSLCSPPLIFGDGTPSFSPDEECYDGGSNVNVTCSGYLFGVTEIGECVEATPSGYWATYPLPTCEESSCPLPTAPHNGLVSPVNQNSLYDEIVYSCDDGLFLDGPGMAVCIGTGQWSPTTVPTCSGNCTIPVITNGEATSSDDVLQEGSQMTISCSEEYTLTGVTDFRCHNEEWNPDAGECLANCPSPDIANSDFATNQSETDHGDFIIVTVTCDDGFTSGTGDNVSEPLTCGNGSWDVDVYCYSNCPLISAPDDGYANNLVEPFYHGRIVAFNCSLGFTLVGDSSSTCDDGNWLNAVPECKANCPLISAPDDGYANSLVEPFYHGRIVTFNCSLGFTLVGDSSSTCDDGNWLNAVPECIAGVPSGSKAPIVGITVGAILVIVIVIISIFIFYKRSSDESATTESKGKESDSSPQYENSVFDQSQTDVHTYEDLNTNAQRYENFTDPHTYQNLNFDTHTYQDLNFETHTYQDLNTDSHS